MDSFEQELKQGFLEEASQLLTDVESCFLILESNPSDQPTLEKIFRLAHNLKGSAKAVGFDDLGAFTHEFESFLLKVKSDPSKISGRTVTLLLECNDHIVQMVNGLKADLNACFDSTPLIAALQNPDSLSAASCDANNESSQEAEETKSEEPSVEEASALMAALTSQNLEAPKIQAPLPSAAPNAAGKAKTANAEESIRVSLVRLEKLLNFVGELVILQTVLREQSYSNNPLLLRKTVHQMGKVTKEVQDISMSLRMVPLKQTFQKMQRIVRDTATLLSKKVALTLVGEETELDKTVLENISDPLVHLIRNAVDHGLEMPEDRKAKGKSETGHVTLSAYHQSGKLVIEVKDDGAGIDPARLRQKAEEKGILKPGTILSDKEAVHLIFHPGFSTKANVTEVSGRGVGMDVVKTNIEALQGEVQVETKLGEGTTFKVYLPLTLAIIDGMIVQSEEDRFVIPLSHVHESVRPSPEDIQFTTGMGEILLLRGENLQIHRLSGLLGRKSKAKAAHDCIALVIRTQSKPFAVLVDDILGQHQIVIKKLGSEIQNLKGISGSAILGDGKPALILELGDLTQNNQTFNHSKWKGAVA